MEEKEFIRNGRLFFYIKNRNGGIAMSRKWTKQSAEEYIRKCKEKGLTYWSAVDFLKKHRVMYSII